MQGLGITKQMLNALYSEVDIDDKELFGELPVQTQIFALKLSVPGMSHQEISDRLGCSKLRVKEELNSPDAESLWRQVETQHREFLVTLRLKACYVMEELLGQENRPEIRLKAAQFISKNTFSPDAEADSKNKKDKIKFITSVSDGGAMNQKQVEEDDVIEAEYEGSITEDDI